MLKYIYIHSVCVVLIIILQAVQIPFFNKIKSPHIKKYAANTGWVFADFFLRQGLNIIVGIYVARYLKPELFGLLSYASVYMQILMPFALLGLNQVVIRELVKNEIDKDKILGTAFVLKICSSIVTMTIIVVLSIIFESVKSLQLYIIIASLSLLFSPFQIIDYFFQAKVQSKFIVYSQQIASITTAIVRLILVLTQAKLTAFVILVAAESFIVAFSLLFFFILKKNSVKKWTFDRGLVSMFKKEIIQILLASFFVSLYVRIDQVMLRYLATDKDLGIYTAAVKLSEPFYVVATLLLSSLFPAIVNGLQISYEEYSKRIQKLYNLLLWIAIICSIIITLFSSLIIDAIYGIDYISSKSVLIIYFWASPFVFLGVVAGNAMMIEKKQKYSIIMTCLGAITNVVLNFILIPLYGVNGAAFATLVSYAGASYFFNFLFPQTRMIFFQQSRGFLGLSDIYIKIKTLLKSK